MTDDKPKRTRKPSEYLVETCDDPTDARWYCRGGVKSFLSVESANKWIDEHADEHGPYRIVRVCGTFKVVTKTERSVEKA